jgi:beta-glucosidase
LEKTCNTKIGLTFAFSDVQSAPGGEENARKAWEDNFRQYLDAIEDDDFIGVQNYTREVYGADGKLEPEEGAELTDMGYEYYPEALGNVVRRVAKDWSKPLYITENGISTNNDLRRIDFITSAWRGSMAALLMG